jgi:lysozyme
MPLDLKQLLIKHEGRRSKPYTCTGGAQTIGVGWNLDAHPLPDHIAGHLRKYGRITDKMIDELLDISIELADADCRKLFPDFNNFTEGRRMALTDFLFQLGYTRARRFVKSIALINARQWEDAAAEMRRSDWWRQTTNRANAITEMIEEG